MSGNFLPPFLVRFAHKVAQDIFIIRASDAALRYFNILGTFRNQGATRGPPPSNKISLLLANQRPKWKIGRAASLDIILKISHTIFCTNRMITKGRKLPDVFEYSKLFLQLRTWCKLLDSLDLVKNLQLTHCNRLNHVLYSETTFPAPELYLLRHTLKEFSHLYQKRFQNVTA